MKIFSQAFVYIDHFWTVIEENKGVSSLAGVLAATVQFYIHSFQIDIFLLLGLILLIGINTWSGIRLAKKEGRFDLKILKESVMSKTVGYLILLISLSVFLGILFIASLRDDTRLFSDYWLNLPIVLLIVFLAGVEFKSTLDNLEALGVTVPLFIRKIPERVNDKIDDLTNIN